MENNFPKLNIQTDTSLEELDFDIIRQERLNRNRHFLEIVSPVVAANILPHAESVHKEITAVQAVTCIQRYWRGYKGRQIYLTKLLEQFEKEEQQQLEKVQQQVEEGQLLIENHQLEVLFDDGKTIRRNAQRLYLTKIIILQRAWRSYILKKHCIENNKGGGIPEKLYTYHQDNCSQDDVKGSYQDPENLGSEQSDKEKEELNTHTKKFKTKPKLLSGNGSDVSPDFVDNLNDADNGINVSPDIVDHVNDADNGIDVSPDIADHVNDTDNGTDFIDNVIDADNGDTYSSLKLIKKNKLLAQAHRFAELKKINSNILPLDLHLHMCHSDNTMLVGLKQDNSDRELTRMSDSMAPFNDAVIYASEINSDIGCTRSDCDGSSNIQNKISNSSKKIGEGGNQQLSKGPIKCESSIFKEKLTEHVETVKDTEVNNCDIELVSCDGMESTRSVREELDTFDVYSIETALLDMDWTMLEEKLKAASEEAKQIQEARRNDREEIRKKLAMAGDDCCDDEEGDEDISYKKSTLQSRLHSGLQICFMNESPGDTDSEGLSPKQHILHDNLKLMSKVSSHVDSDNNYSTVRDLNATVTAVTHIEGTAPAPRLQAHLQDTTTSEEDYQSKRDQLQNEAKMALAQVGIPSCLGERRQKKISLCQLQQMNLAQIQVLYNDLQTQIESLNEELVHLLMDRDEQHMEQDSMLVDIEDLTRRAEELAVKTNREGCSKAKVEGKLPAR